MGVRVTVDSANQVPVQLYRAIHTDPLSRVAYAMRHTGDRFRQAEVVSRDTLDHTGCIIIRTPLKLKIIRILNEKDIYVCV